MNDSQSYMTILPVITNMRALRDSTEGNALVCNQPTQVLTKAQYMFL